ncbi:MAG: ribonuclease 3 [Patescibacteria group bacterium]|nr:MAG: ribonuclease 3 [Patescibacteria group bacterium]
MKRLKKLKNLEKNIGISFKNPDLLKQALVHRSYLNESDEFEESNERLEFLGDSLLNFVTAEYLYLNYPDVSEGEATDIRSQLVSKPALAKSAKKIDLGSFLYLSKGEIRSGGRQKESLLADTMEALIAVIYLDQGLKVCKEFVIKFLIEPYLKELLKGYKAISVKTLLQQFTQGRFHLLPEYKVISEQGPDHNKVYEVGVWLNDRLLAKAKAGSKKEAEKLCAKIALSKLQSESS